MISGFVSVVIAAFVKFVLDIAVIAIIKVKEMINEEMTCIELIHDNGYHQFVFYIKVVSLIFIIKPR